MFKNRFCGAVLISVSTIVVALSAQLLRRRKLNPAHTNRRNAVAATADFFIALSRPSKALGLQPYWGQKSKTRA
ncbi:UNVERIFIED_ORG: hypothetical protein ABIB19_001639 [Arthrobacter sp. UYEF10]